MDPSIAALLSKLNPATLAAVERRNLDVSDSLSQLAPLLKNPEVVATVRRLHSEQRELEQRLQKERDKITTSFQGKLQSMTASAALLGTAVPVRQVDQVNESFNSALKQHAASQALPAWDGILARQQSELEKLGVPNMFVSQDPSDRQRQATIIAILETVLLAES